MSAGTPLEVPLEGGTWLGGTYEWSFEEPKPPFLNVRLAGTQEPAALRLPAEARLRWPGNAEGEAQSDRLTVARLDRLTHLCHILEMNGESYRLSTARQRGNRPAPRCNLKRRPSRQGRATQGSPATCLPGRSEPSSLCP